MFSDRPHKSMLVASCREICVSALPRKKQEEKYNGRMRGNIPGRWEIQLLYLFLPLAISSASPVITTIDETAAREGIQNVNRRMVEFVTLSVFRCTCGRIVTCFALHANSISQACTGDIWKSAPYIIFNQINDVNVLSIFFFLKSHVL